MEFLREMKGRTVFRDVSVLSFDYVPEELPHRENELKKLASIFKPVLSSQVSQNVLITGKVGTGKTVSAKYFCKHLSEFSRGEGKIIDFVLVNCRKQSTESLAMLRIVNHFDPNFPSRGFSVTDMLKTVRRAVDEKRMHLIIILDEVDVLIKRAGTDLIYNLTRFDEENMERRGSISLIMISQRYALDMLDPASLSTFKRSNVVEMSPYSQKELKDILAKRAELAFHSKVVDETIIELISDIASESGDARFAIELLWKAGMIADDEGEECITPEHVRAAKAETHPFITEDRLLELGNHQKFILIAVAELLRSDAYTTTGDLEEQYKVICEEFETKPVSHTRLWELINELSVLGFIDAKKSSKGRVGQTTLISLPDIPARVLEEELRRILRH